VDARIYARNATLQHISELLSSRPDSVETIQVAGAGWDIGWFVETRGLDSVDLSAHLHLLKKKLGNGIMSLQEAGVDFMAYSCIFFEGSYGGGPVFSPDDLCLLESIGLEVLVEFFSI